ncbi:hypothetical protein HK104_004950 [Borealophlyctis nickersoniae]|nr:hypothetical protein HK104_004950 [Borealophlyctis nickersoniae]
MFRNLTCTFLPLLEASRRGQECRRKIALCCSCKRQNSTLSGAGGERSGGRAATEVGGQQRSKRTAGSADDTQRRQGGQPKVHRSPNGKPPGFKAGKSDYSQLLNRFRTSAARKRWSEAWDVYCTIEKQFGRGLLDLADYNNALRAIMMGEAVPVSDTSGRCHRAAQRVYASLRIAGHKPDRDTFLQLLAASGRDGFVDEANSIIRQMEEAGYEVEADEGVLVQRAGAAAVAGQLNLAEDYLAQMNAKYVVPPPWLIVKLMSAYTRAKRLDVANYHRVRELFEGLKVSAQQHSAHLIKAYIWRIKSIWVYASEFERRAEIKTLLDEAERDLDTIPTELWNAAIAAHVNAMDLSSACALLDRMQRNGAATDKETATLAITLAAKAADPVRAWSFFDQKLKHVNQWDRSVLENLAKANGPLAQSLDPIVNAMREATVIPSKPLLWALMKGYAQLDDLNSMKVVLEDMFRLNWVDGEVVNTMIGVHIKREDVDEARALADRAADVHGVRWNSTIFTNLLVGYATKGKKEEFASILEKMDKLAIKPQQWLVHVVARKFGETHPMFRQLKELK